MLNKKGKKATRKIKNGRKNLKMIRLFAKYQLNEKNIEKY